MFQVRQVGFPPPELCKSLDLLSLIEVMHLPGFTEAAWRVIGEQRGDVPRHLMPRAALRLTPYDSDFVMDENGELENPELAYGGDWWVRRDVEKWIEENR